jgi:hypothetical protein
MSDPHEIEPEEEMPWWQILLFWVAAFAFCIGVLVAVIKALLWWVL